MPCTWCWTVTNNWCKGVRHKYHTNYPSAKSYSAKPYNAKPHGWSPDTFSAKMPSATFPTLLVLDPDHLCMTTMMMVVRVRMMTKITMMLMMMTADKLSGRPQASLHGATYLWGEALGTPSHQNKVNLIYEYPDMYVADRACFRIIYTSGNTCKVYIELKIIEK